MSQLILPPHFEIRVGIHGIGAFVTKNVKKGEVLFKLQGPIVTQPSRTSVQVAKGEHIEDVLAGHINHSCTPTAKVSRRLRAFVSLRNIQSGEEITFDYNQNEDMLASPFICACCGSSIVGRKIKKPSVVLG